MLVVGDSVYKDCECPEEFSGIALACPFKGAIATRTRREWCKACLISKIVSLEWELKALADRAKQAANNSY